MEKTIRVETPVQIRFEDTDMYGHVNNTNIQSYFDIGKCDYYVKVFKIPMLHIEKGLIGKANSNVYEAQTRFGEELVVYTEIQKVGTKSMTFYQEIHNRHTGELKAYSTAVLVAYNFHEQETIPVPEEWKRAMVGE